MPVLQKSKKATGSFSFTSFEANAWKGRFGNSGVNVLVDPWLVGELTFAGQSWLYCGRKNLNIDVDAVVADVDFVLITQSLPDHAHEPTLRALPRHLPVVCSQSAGPIVRSCGLQDVTELDHGQTLNVAGNRMKLRATKGALTGPPWDKRQNGFFLEELTDNGLNVYYEPHCDFEASSVETDTAVDVVITPVINQQLGAKSVGFPLVMGDDNIEKLLGQLKPRVLVPLENASFTQEGPLSKAIVQKSTGPDLEERLRQAGLSSTKIRRIKGPGEELVVEL